MYERERREMVTGQLESRGIIDKRVLEAIKLVERHRFVSAADRADAYTDRPLGIGSGQTISQPFMVALMTQTLDLQGSERVLEIGTGSGYQTAILAELASEVYTVERIASLLAKARKTLTGLGYDNIFYRVGDGSLGWVAKAPFDRVLVTAAAPGIPDRLMEQVSLGGRLVAPIGGRVAQELNLVVKGGEGTLQVFHRGGCVFVPLIGEGGWQDG